MSGETLERSMDQKQKNLSDHFREWFKGGAQAAAGFLLRLGIKPNTVTITGLVGHIIGAVLVASGWITLGGILVLIMAPLDFLDGTMARMRGESSRFGAFVDSVTDRYSEFVIMGGLLYYYLSHQDWTACILVYLAVTGSIMVSYTRSRGEALGFEVKIGVLTRLERYLVLVPGLIFNIPRIALWIIAILANFTALQRIWHVRRQSYSEMAAEKQN
jgi:CDP-diacylglycerol---glycerol-3-phosphate 3-phosphatidyltransferase